MESNDLVVLVVCEYSGAVSRAFREQGHYAYSCDLLPADNAQDEIFHFECDYRDAIEQVLKFHGRIDILIGHPPCTALCSSGNRWYAAGKPKAAERPKAVEFVREMMEVFDQVAEIGWVIENPVGVLSKEIRPPTQYVQPYEYGHGEVKKTGLWVSGLPELTPTDIVEGREPKVWRMSPSEDRWKLRSATYAGIARAMAEQWAGPRRGEKNR